MAVLDKDFQSNLQQPVQIRFYCLIDLSSALDFLDLN